MFQITIYDAQGNEIVDQFAMSNEGQTLAPFSESVPFTVTQATPACLWVYEISAQDGNADSRRPDPGHPPAVADAILDR